MSVRLPNEHCGTQRRDLNLGNSKKISFNADQRTIDAMAKYLPVRRFRHSLSAAPFPGQDKLAVP